MPPAGVEPATLGLLDPRSNRLSYGGCRRRVKCEWLGQFSSKHEFPYKMSGKLQDDLQIGTELFLGTEKNNFFTFGSSLVY